MYEYPTHSPACLVRNRFSIHCLLLASPAVVSSANDFTSTVSSGKSQPLPAPRLILKSTAAFSGMAKNRSLYAPSDQRGELTEYGITPGCMAWSLTLANRPLS